MNLEANTCRLASTQGTVAALNRGPRYILITSTYSPETRPGNSEKENQYLVLVW